MNIQPFALERYFAQHEFSARYLLSSSDCESLSLLELVEMAGEDNVELWIDLRLGYTESQGHPLLRQNIAETYSSLSADDVLIVVPEEGIFLLMNAMLKPGDHMICTFPGYQSLYEIAWSLGCEVSYWKPDEQNGWRFNLEDLEKQVRADTKLVVANFPHNPTGFVPAADEYDALIDLLSKKEIPLLSDEMYRELEVQEDSTLPAGCDVYSQGISLSGLSKSYGLPGLRIGWLGTQDQALLKKIATLKDYTTICSSAPSEILAIIALGNREAIIAGHLNRIRKHLDLLDQFFEDYGDIFRWNRPLGGSIGFPRLLLDQGATDFCSQLVEETGIMMAPSSVFQYGDRHVRVGFGRENLPEVIGVFSVYLDSEVRQRGNERS